ncbi:MAG: glycosyltransferase [Ruminococcaceae bacterium]|nr:glycosyltransferase [Oscillospiraceae bacterium]
MKPWTNMRRADMNKEKLIVIIPAYEPTREFTDYARRVAAFAEELVVVNDGSGSDYDGIFKEIQAIENVKYITYGENHGKGYALKRAFQYCADTYDDSYACVTADCDGQHDTRDDFCM